MKTVLLAVVMLHGLIHLLGAARGWGLLILPDAQTPISFASATLWFATACVFFLFLLGWWLVPAYAWILGTVAVVSSQVLIVSAWPDAKWGTLGNLLALLTVVYAFASEGAYSLRADYQRTLLERRPAPTERLVTEADVGTLPAPVARYLRTTRTVGRPMSVGFSAKMVGRIRGGPGEEWMPFQAEQTSYLAEPTRLFFLRATKGGLPVDVLHRFVDGQATMQVRLLSLFPLTHESGPALTRAETVTIFNDMCIFAPSSLLSNAVTWDAQNDLHAVGHFTLGSNRVSAQLTFNESGELVDFVSDDRSVQLQDGELRPQRWSTPVRDYQRYGELYLATRGEGVWHPDAGRYTYIELEITEHRMHAP